MVALAKAPALTIRAARASEEDVVIDLMLAANEEHRRKLPPAIFEMYTADLRVLPTRPDIQIAVAERQGPPRRLRCLPSERVEPGWRHAELCVLPRPCGHS